MRASVQPTFVRFVFEMPDGVNVSSVLNEQKLTLSFNAVLTFDLADAKVAAPPNIASINQKIEGDTSAVEITMIGDVDVHSFREDKNYIVDVAFQQSENAVRAVAAAAEALKAPACSRRPADPAAAAPAAAGNLRHRAGRRDRAADLGNAGQASQHRDQAGRRAQWRGRSCAGRRRKRSPNACRASETQMLPHLRPGNDRTRRKRRWRRLRSRRRRLPAAPPQKMAVAPEPPPETKAGDSDASVDARRDSDGLRLTFSFASATPAALFRRADTVWVVFDSTKPIDVAPIRNKGGAIIAEATRVPLENGQAIRIRLNRPQMPSLVGGDQPDGAKWTVIFADTMQTPTQPLTANATSPIPAMPMSRWRWPSPALCIGWSIRMPAIPSWWSPRRRRFAASSSGRTLSSCRCWNRFTASPSVRIPTTSPSRSHPTRSSSAGRAA